MKKYIITGLLIWIPLVITLWVLKLIVDSLDNVLLLLPPEFRTENWLGIHVPGMGAVMTLPGIAGFVLTMGMGVDSNVLIFERIKEEIEAQRGVRAAVNAGFSRVFLTLLDTHIAALISAGFLFQFGTGPIRGFAVTLFAGLVANLFTATFVSKTLFELVLSRQRQVATLSI